MFYDILCVWTTSTFTEELAYIISIIILFGASSTGEKYSRLKLVTDYMN